MDTNLASQAAIRISQLWPTLNPEQLRMATRALLSPDFDSVVVANVLADMYLRDTKFFDLAELTKRVRESKENPDPLLQPNSYESCAKRRQEANREWEERALSVDKLKTWWAGLARVDQLDMIDLFKLSADYVELKEFYDVQFGKERAPIPFLQWANLEARMVTKTR